MMNYFSFDLILNGDTHQLLWEAARLLRNYPLGYYDGVYLALAQQVGGQFVTADDRFYQRAREHFPNVIWLGDVLE